MQVETLEDIKLYLEKIGEISSKETAQEVIGVLTKDESIWRENHNWLYDRVYGDIYCALGIAYRIVGDYTNSRSIVDYGLEQMQKRDFRYLFSYKACLYQLSAWLYCQSAQKENALTDAKHYFHNLLYAYYNVGYSSCEFISFRSASDFVINDLRKQTISCSPISSFNDPLDTPLINWYEEYNKQHTNDVEHLFGEVLKEAFMFLRVRSFARDTTLPFKKDYDMPFKRIVEQKCYDMAMWAYYADNHKGVCCKYQIPQEVLSKEPEDETLTVIAPIRYIDELPLAETINMEEAMLYKHKTWEHENESRLLFYSTGEDVAYPIVSLPECLKEVYIGYKCDRQKQILEALKDQPQVKVFQMKLDENNLLRLRAEQIK